MESEKAEETLWAVFYCDDATMKKS